MLLNPFARLKIDKLPFRHRYSPNLSPLNAFHFSDTSLLGLHFTLIHYRPGSMLVSISASSAITTKSGCSRRLCALLGPSLLLSTSSHPSIMTSGSRHPTQPRILTRPFVVFRFHLTFFALIVLFSYLSTPRIALTYLVCYLSRPLVSRRSSTSVSHRSCP